MRVCPGADPQRVTQQLRQKLALNAAAMQLPIGAEDKLKVRSQGLIADNNRKAWGGKE